jgi:hypothetical protein
MSQALATPPPPLSEPRGFFARTWADPDGRSTMVGVSGVILFYLLLWIFAPYLLRFDHVPTAMRPHAAAKQFNIEMAPNTFISKPPPKLPDRFVEANPDAPDQAPDKTRNFSFMNQQVAQEKPTPDGKNDMPALEGKKDFQSTQIVSGQLTKPIEHVEATPPPVEAQEAKTAQMPRLEQNPLPGFEKKEGESKDGFGTNIAKLPDNPRAIPDRIEGQKNVQDSPDAVQNQPAIDPQHPRARPQIVKQQQVRPAIFAENKFGTQNIGNIAVDAKWSNYGAYLQRMIEAVQLEWDNILTESKSYPGSGTYVAVKFILDSEGHIKQIVGVDNHSTEQGSRWSVSAITNRDPYGPWTDDMIAILGKQQEMTFTFYYQ